MRYAVLAMIFDLHTHTRCSDGALSPGELLARAIDQGVDVLAVTDSGAPAVFRVGNNSYGFLGNPGIKLGMVEDLIMEFEEVPGDTAEGLETLRSLQRTIEDELVPIMTGLVQCTALMSSPRAADMSADELDKQVI